MSLFNFFNFHGALKLPWQMGICKRISSTIGNMRASAEYDLMQACAQLTDCGDDTVETQWPDESSRLPWLHRCFIVRGMVRIYDVNWTKLGMDINQFSHQVENVFKPTKDRLSSEQESLETPPSEGPSPPGKGKRSGKPPPDPAAQSLQDIDAEWEATMLRLEQMDTAEPWQSVDEKQVTLQEVDDLPGRIRTPPYDDGTFGDEVVRVGEPERKKRRVVTDPEGIDTIQQVPESNGIEVQTEMHAPPTSIPEIVVTHPEEPIERPQQPIERPEQPVEPAVQVADPLLDAPLAPPVPVRRPRRAPDNRIKRLFIRTATKRRKVKALIKENMIEAKSLPVPKYQVCDNHDMTYYINKMAVPALQAPRARGQMKSPQLAVPPAGDREGSVERPAKRIRLSPTLDATPMKIEASVDEPISMQEPILMEQSVPMEQPDPMEQPVPTEEPIPTKVHLLHQLSTMGRPCKLSEICQQPVNRQHIIETYAAVLTLAKDGLVRLIKDTNLKLQFVEFVI